jgi:hypothetical protein
MPTQTDLFNELANLTQLYLLQEYKLSEWIFSEPESYAFFKQLASEQKKQPSAVKQTNPTPAAVIAKPEPIVPKTIPPLAKEKPLIEKKPAAPVTIVPAAAIPVAIEKEPSRLIKLEVMEPPKAVDFSDLKTILRERYPHLQIIEETPDGIKNQKKAQAVVLYTTSHPLDKAFLANLTHAIDICLAPASLVNASKIESSNGWGAFLNLPHLKRVLIVQQDLDRLPKLALHYASTPLPSLGKIRVLALPEPSLIYKEPNRKQTLWTSLEFFFAADSDEKLS